MDCGSAVAVVARLAQHPNKASRHFIDAVSSLHPNPAHGSGVPPRKVAKYDYLNTVTRRTPTVGEAAHGGGSGDGDDSDSDGGHHGDGEARAPVPSSARANAAGGDRMIEELVLSSASAQFQQLPAAVRPKLVLHRGWHDHSSFDAASSLQRWRPLENTRNAYRCAAALGAGRVECDVWVTSDGHVVISHDPSLERVAMDPSQPHCTRPISSTPWSTVAQTRLVDGSFPVLLETALEDLLPTQTRLVVEYKDSSVAVPVAKLLLARPDLVPAVAMVISFNVRSLESFYDHVVASDHHPHVDTLLQTIGISWLVQCRFLPSDTELDFVRAFDCSRERLADFLSSVEGLRDLMVKMRCGLYMEWNAAVEPAHLVALRADLEALHAQRAPSGGGSGRQGCGARIGMWNRGVDTALMDSASKAAAIAAHLDDLNTDLPDAFYD